jgi:glycosyltransferase involved in cell wall biosynthesis
MPRVSVIIPTYNRADCVVDAIRSVQRQTVPDVEIVVADDGSTDGTAVSVQSLGDAVVYLSLRHRGRPAAARNAGLRQAQSEFIAFLDSDDLFLPHKLRVQLAALEASPKAGMVYSDGYFVRNYRDQPLGHVLDAMPTPTGDVFPALVRGNFLFPAVVLVRRVCLDLVGVFDEDAALVGVEDYDLWLRIAARFPVVYVPGDVAAIRRHQGSLSRDTMAIKRGVLAVLSKLRDLHPDLAHQHRVCLYEAYARCHGAIALHHLRKGRAIPGFRHGLGALAYTTLIPGRGLRAFGSWLRHRRQRRAAQP